MKNQILLYFALLLCATLQAQSLTMTWSSQPGEIPPGDRMFDPFSPAFTDDFDGDGSNDMVWVKRDRNSLLVVNGQDRSQRTEYPLSQTLNVRPKDVEVYFTTIIENNPVVLLLTNNENLPGRGIRDDGQVIIENSILTYPQTHQLLDVRDYDGDGYYTYTLKNLTENRIEMWDLQ